MPEPLCASLHEKIDEQIELTIHLIGRLPEDSAAITPIQDSWPIGMLLAHFTDCVAGFCAVLMAAAPERLGHFAALRESLLRESSGPEEAISRIRIFQAAIAEGFEVLRDSDLARPLPTVFVPAGESVLTLLLGNLEHLINHKRQLFDYLKIMGVNIGTSDLYCFRG
jgi:hypothetical protein